MIERTRITPVILSGGSGTRLWPLSRVECPKQFLPLVGDATMFRATVARCSDTTRFTDPIIVANASHVDLIRAQSETTDALLVLEPVARNTAPAIALAALLVEPATPLLVMPSDHVIIDEVAFAAAIDAALPLVEDGWLVTFGITPSGPETGYGYIHIGEAIAPGVNRVTAFVEKPDRARAEMMIAGGEHVWNGGIFLFRADAYLAALAAEAPAILTAARAAIDGASRAGDHIVPALDAFATSPSDSIDYAVMERRAGRSEGRVAVVPVDMGWSDVGSWDALYTLNAGADGDAHRGDIIAIDTEHCLVRSDGIRIAAVGVSDLIVVASGRDILIMPRGRSQEVKRILAAIEARPD